MNNNEIFLKLCQLTGLSVDMSTLSCLIAEIFLTIWEMKAAINLLLVFDKLICTLNANGDMHRHINLMCCAACKHWRA